MAEREGRFAAWDLASLDEQVADYVDELLARGVIAWRCEYYATFHIPDGRPERLEWHCEVTINPYYRQLSV